MKANREVVTEPGVDRAYCGVCQAIGTGLRNQGSCLQCNIVGPP